MALDIDTHLTLRPQDAPPDAMAALRTWALERWCIDNPAYWQAREHRRPCKHIPRRFELASLAGEDLILPRGANLDLKKQLQAAGIAVDVVDRRAAPALTAPVQLHVELRPYQRDAVARAASLRDGVVVAPTGSGKTVIAMGIIAELQVRTLIVVHTRTLLEQTCAVIERTLGLTAGRLGGGHDDVRDVTVATVQTLVRHDPAQLRDTFGLLLLDEAHHCPAGTFTDVVQRFSARWRIGLTATPERADQLHPLMYAALGPELFRVPPGEMVDVGSLVAPTIVPVSTSFAGGRMTDRGKMITRLCEDEQRNGELVATIRATRGTHALVLSDRVQHCEALVELLLARDVRAFLLVGRMAMPARQAALDAFLRAEDAVLVATGSLLGEGFDCPDLDTLYLVVPSGNITRTTQALGRVLRPSPGKAAPHVVDFVDVETPALAKAFKKRLAVYLRHRAVVHDSRPANPPH